MCEVALDRVKFLTAQRPLAITRIVLVPAKHHAVLVDADVIVVIRIDAEQIVRFFDLCLQLFFGGNDLVVITGTGPAVVERTVAEALIDGVEIFVVSVGNAIDHERTAGTEYLCLVRVTRQHDAACLWRIFGFEITLGSRLEQGIWRFEIFGNLWHLQRQTQ